MSWYEDLEIGHERTLGAHLFTAAEIIAFAKEFDPQPFHLSKAGGQASLFGGLAASGWHTASVWMKVMVADQQREAAAALARGEEAGAFGPSPGFEDLRWLKPVMAGDTITYRIIITDRRPSASRPQWGLVTFLNEGHNQRGEHAFVFTGRVFAPRRTKSPAVAD